MEVEKAIGIFDSGIGGLTVMREIVHYLPFEDIIYFGDIGRAPYGGKSKETVSRYSWEITHFLISQGVKMIVIACNTATAFSLEELREAFKLPIIGVIEPGIKRALEVTRNKRIGIIGTEGTISSGAYQKGIESYTKGEVKITGIPCPLFVPLVEEGWVDTEVSLLVASEYLTPLRLNGIDTLILGCTHYPLLKGVIQKVMGDGVELVDSATQVAMETKDLLSKSGLVRKSNRESTRKFYVSDLPPKFKELAKRFLGEEIGEIGEVIRVAIDGY